MLRMSWQIPRVSRWYEFSGHGTGLSVLPHAFVWCVSSPTLSVCAPLCQTRSGRSRCTVIAYTCHGFSPSGTSRRCHSARSPHGCLDHLPASQTGSPTRWIDVSHEDGARSLYSVLKQQQVPLVMAPAPRPRSPSSPALPPLGSSGDMENTPLDRPAFQLRLRRPPPCFLS